MTQKPRKLGRYGTQSASVSDRARAVEKAVSKTARRQRNATGLRRPDTSRSGSGQSRLNTLVNPGPLQFYNPPEDLYLQLLSGCPGVDPFGQTDESDPELVAWLPEREAARRLGIPRSILQRFMAERRSEIATLLTEH